VKPQNAKRRHAQVLSRPIPEDKGTCGFIQRIPAGVEEPFWLSEENDLETGRL